MKITCRLLKYIAILFCSIFTVATIASCIINLLMGNTNDTYFHILDRAVITLIGSIIIGIVADVDFKNPIFNCLIPYLIFIILAFLYVFISGFFVELHPIAYIIVYVSIAIYKNRAKRKINN